MHGRRARLARRAPVDLKESSAHTGGCNRSWIPGALPVHQEDIKSALLDDHVQGSITEGETQHVSNLPLNAGTLLQLLLLHLLCNDLRSH